MTIAMCDRQMKINFLSRSVFGSESFASAGVGLKKTLVFSIGNSGKQIGRVERGENNVTTLMIYRIAKALEVPIQEFFEAEFEGQRVQ